MKDTPASPIQGAILATMAALLMSVLMTIAKKLPEAIHSKLTL